MPPIGTHFLDDLSPIRRWILKLRGSVGDGMQGVFSVWRQGNPHQKNRHPMFPARLGQSRRVLDHEVRRIRGGLPPDIAFLEVYDHQSRLCLSIIVFFILASVHSTLTWPTRYQPSFAGASIAKFSIRPWSAGSINATAKV